MWTISRNSSHHSNSVHGHPIAFLVIADGEVWCIKGHNYGIYKTSLYLTLSADYRISSIVSEKFIHQFNKIDDNRKANVLSLTLLINRFVNFLETILEIL